MRVHVTDKHLGLRPFKCDECNKSKLIYSELFIHPLTNFNVLGFVTKHIMISHKARYHMTIKNYECEVCKRRFTSNAFRNAHRVASHEDGKHHCTMCSQKFRVPSQLKAHLDVHNGIRNANCSMCDKKFFSRKYLLNHIKEIHFKNKITCEICGTKLARIVNYEMHVKAKHQDIGEEALTALKLRMKKIKANFEKMEFYYEN